MRRASRSHSPCVPALESRQLLAGTVTTTIARGTLTVRGDNYANDLAIAQTAGGLRIQALNGTKLNGIANGEITVSNPTRTNIDLMWGDDRLSLAGYLSGDFKVLLGYGNDQLDVLGISCEKSMSIDLGVGNDRFLASPGTDDPHEPNVVGGNFSLLGGYGNDRIIVKSLNALSNLTLDAGVGNDVVSLEDGYTVGTTSVLLGDGNDIMSIGQRTSRGLFGLNAGTGDDLLGMQDGEFQQAATFDMGTGKDTILSQRNTFYQNVTRAGGASPWRTVDTLFTSGDSLNRANSVLGFESLPTSEAQVAAQYSTLNAAFA